MSQIGDKLDWLGAWIGLKSYLASFVLTFFIGEQIRREEVKGKTTLEMMTRKPKKLLDEMGLRQLEDRDEAEKELRSFVVDQIWNQN